jgi:ankyrin repeat protein
LIEYEADVNVKNKHGCTALMEASVAGHTEIANALLDAKANIDVGDHNQSTALIKASTQGQTEIVDILVKRRADIRARSSNGLTALDKAIAGEYPDIVQLLVSNTRAAYDLYSEHPYMIDESKYSISSKGAYLRPQGNTYYEKLVQKLAHDPNNQKLLKIKQIFDGPKVTFLLPSLKQDEASPQALHSFYKSPLVKTVFELAFGPTPKLSSPKTNTEGVVELNH